MAVVTNLIQSVLVLKVKEGVAESGKDIIKSRRLGKLSKKAKDEDIFTLCEKIAEIKDNPVVACFKQEEKTIVRE